MTAEDAIALNTATAEDLALHSLPRFAEAVRLGIEALKVEQEARVGLPKGSYDLLPGETEE